MKVGVRSKCMKNSLTKVFFEWQHFTKIYFQKAILIFRMFLGCFCFVLIGIEMVKTNEIVAYFVVKKHDAKPPNIMFGMAQFRFYYNVTTA